MKKYDKIQFNNCQFNLKFLYIFLSLIYLITALSLIPHQKSFSFLHAWQEKIFLCALPLI